MSHYLWGSKFWSAGYFYEGVGNVTSPSIKFYIERQQGKHWTEQELSRTAPRERFAPEDSFKFLLGRHPIYRVVVHVFYFLPLSFLS